MQMRAILLAAVSSVFLAACANTPPVPLPADAYSYPLERALEAKTLYEGWNEICTVPTGEHIFANVVNGSVAGWEVRAADGVLLPSEIRSASPYNSTMLRLWWQPVLGSSRFVEAPAWVLQP